MTQDSYLMILFTDCNYDTVQQRMGFLQRVFNKSYIDELTTLEKSKAIDILKYQKSHKEPIGGISKEQTDSEE